MDDCDRAEMLELCRQFREAMARENDAALFHDEAKHRIGWMIGQAVRQGGSEFGYLRRQA